METENTRRTITSTVKTSLAEIATILAIIIEKELLTITRILPIVIIIAVAAERKEWRTTVA